MTRKNKILIIILSLLTIFMTAFIWSNSVANSEESSEVSEGITEVVCEVLGVDKEEDIETTHIVVRKAAHFIEFCVLGILYMCICTLITGKALSSLVFFPISSVLFTAVIDEYIQSFSVGRGSKVQDVLLDFSGAITGIALVCLINTIMELYRQKHKKN